MRCVLYAVPRPQIAKDAAMLGRQHTDQVAAWPAEAVQEASADTFTRLYKSGIGQPLIGRMPGSRSASKGFGSGNMHAPRDRAIAASHERSNRLQLPTLQSSYGRLPAASDGGLSPSKSAGHLHSIISPIPERDLITNVERSAIKVRF